MGAGRIFGPGVPSDRQSDQSDIPMCPPPSYAPVDAGKHADHPWIPTWFVWTCGKQFEYDLKTMRLAR
jgi:hypothetical protein